MEFNSSHDQTNSMGYHPPSPISNDGWEYHQETSNSGLSNSWSHASEPQDEKEKHMGYFPTPQNDSSHYFNGGWEYYQETANSEQSTHMRDCPTSPPTSTFENSSSTKYASTQTSTNLGLSKLEIMFEKYEREVQRSWNEQENSFKNMEVMAGQLLNARKEKMEKQECKVPVLSEIAKKEEVEEQNEDPLQKSRELLKRQEQFMKEQQQAWKREESLLKNMNEDLEKIRKHLEPLSKKNEGQLMDMKEKVEEQDKEATASSELSMKNEVVEPETALEMTREHEDSQLSQTSLDQNASTFESMIERYDEEMKKCWEDRQTSPMIERLKQMLGVKEEVEEQESEEVIPNSSEEEKYIKEEFMEPPIQEALNEEITPIITQQPCLDIQEVKAINKSTKKRIVTKTPMTTFMRRSTANNPPPDPASKINQANFTRKLAEERPRQGALAKTSPPLKSFLLTNWKKRKKVKNR
ncbi:hypothetical protein AHAS_Ahas11G0185800 [Arachis hypogaea]